MRLTKGILVDGRWLNPLVPEAAGLVEWAYNHWRARAFGDEPHPYLPDGWALEGLEADGVQLVLGSRVFRADDPFDHSGIGRLRAAVIPGTNELRDWAANLNAWPMKLEGLKGRWRRGFATGGEWVWSKLKEAAREDDILAIFGHSYGAAMTLDAAALAARDGNVERTAAVLGFAAPRVTTGKGAEELSLAYRHGVVGQRFILGFDVVPWTVLPLGWHHALSPVFIGADGTVRRKYRFWAEAAAALRSRGVQAVGDHDMGKYRAWADTLPKPIAFVPPTFLGEGPRIGRNGT